MIKKYKKKPVVIEAMQWSGKNTIDIDNFIGRHCMEKDDGILIRTLGGVIRADIDDFIIKGVKGEFYPCRPDIFEQTYEEVKE